MERFAAVARDSGVRLLVALLMPLAGGLLTGVLPATSIKVANLKDLIEQSDRIFVGKCLSAVSSVEGGVPLTTYSFQVIEPLQGIQSETIVVRQFGAATPAPAGGVPGRGVIVQGMPTYRVGVSYLLFLVEESPLGLTSPAGLFQGAFTAKGAGFTNAVDNRNLTRGLPKSWLREKGLRPAEIDRFIGFRGGAIDSGYFLELVRSLSR